MPPSLFPAPLACMTWRRRAWGGCSLHVLLFSAAPLRAWKHLEEAHGLAVPEVPLQPEEGWHLGAAVLLFFLVSGVLHGDSTVATPTGSLSQSRCPQGLPTQAACPLGWSLSGLKPHFRQKKCSAHSETHFRAEWPWLGISVP